MIAHADRDVDRLQRTKPQGIVFIYKFDIPLTGRAWQDTIGLGPLGVNVQYADGKVNAISLALGTSKGAPFSAFSWLTETISQLPHVWTKEELDALPTEALQGQMSTPEVEGGVCR